MSETTIMQTIASKLTVFKLGVLVFLWPAIVSAGSVEYIYDSSHRLKKALYENGLEITYTYDDVGNRLTKTSNMVNLSPNIPSNPIPADGTTIFSSETMVLAWTGGDPNIGDSVTYDLYFGTISDPPIFQSDLSDPNVELTGLGPGRYYWKVVARDQEGLEDEGPVWSLNITADSDGDGISDDDEANLYGTDINLEDTDGDGINDGAELELWGDNWNADGDGDGLINLLDADSDNDGYTDGAELNDGTDPADAASNQMETIKVIMTIILDD